jgi:hypothetical protein
MLYGTPADTCSRNSFLGVSGSAFPCSQSGSAIHPATIMSFFFCAVVHERRLNIQPSDHLNSGGKVDKGEHAPMFHA